MDILECIVLFLTVCVIALALFVIFMSEWHQMRSESNVRTANEVRTGGSQTGGRDQRYDRNSGRGFSEDQFKSWSKSGWGRDSRRTARQTDRDSKHNGKPGSRFATHYHNPFASILEDEILGDILRRLFDDPPEPTPPVVILPTARERYTPGKHFYRPTLHNGQRKLLLTEIAALNKIAAAIKDDSDTNIVVYAGSSPCNKLYMLAKMFPEIKFVLVDPNETQIYVQWEDSDFTSGRQQRQDHYTVDTGDIIYMSSIGDNRYSSVGTKMITYLSPDGPTRIARRDYTTAEWTPVDRAVDFIRDSSARIFIFEQYMTVELAEQFKRLSPHFWCDIRTNSSEGATLADGTKVQPGDTDAMWNMAQQYNWIQAMSPKTYMLKFRAPFFDDINASMAAWNHAPYAADIDAATDLNIRELYPQRKFRYLGGEIYLQPWPGISSSESRLCGTPDMPLQDYDVAEYEDRFYRYNRVERWATMRENPYVESRTRAIGFDFCNDCALEASIWDDYRSLGGATYDEIIGHIVGLCAITGRDLRYNGHGDFVQPRTEAKYNSLLHKHGSSMKM